MYGHGRRRFLCAHADYVDQTLRFVQSLPKRERQPLTNKFKNADPLGLHSPIPESLRRIPPLTVVSSN